VFGDAEESVIKCGSYVGNGSTQVIDIGFEAQWVLTKNIDSSYHWCLADNMRGAADAPGDNNQPVTLPNENNADPTGNYIGMNNNGFKLLGSENISNRDGDTYIYMCVRRSDGYVGKPYGAGEGTSVFAMDTGNSSSTIPNFDSGFPVDFAFAREPASTGQWDTGARLIQGKYLAANTNAAEATSSDFTFDSSVGWNKISSWGSSYQSWMWKRHAGLDVVCYEGHYNSQAITISHSLNKIPEMMWIKQRTDAGYSWIVYHKGFNGGTNPHQYFMMLNSTDAETFNAGFFPSAPTSTSIRLSGSAAAVNNANKNYLMMLFASVDGISSVGSFTGSDSAQSINCGFQPRFVIIKNLSNNGGAGGDSWVVLDTTRGWGSGNDNALLLNWSDAQTSWEAGAPTSTGFDLPGNVRRVNKSGRNYIYYCHA